MGKMVLPMSVDEYWSLFHDGEYSLEKFFDFRHFRNIEATIPWTDQIDDPNFKKGLQGRQALKVKQIKYTCDVKDNPMVKVSD